MICIKCFYLHCIKILLHETCHKKKEKKLKIELSTNFKMILKSSLEGYFYREFHPN